MASIYLGSDHGGFRLKGIIYRYLKASGNDAKDVGPCKFDKGDDYPDYAKLVCEKVAGTKNLGVLICSSGQGMDRAANKVKGIYASVCWNVRSVEYARAHGGINVLCLPGDFVSDRTAKAMVQAWLDTPISMESRHKRRRIKIKKIESYGIGKH
jgi:ribose 5-phosphate isomerase B